MTAATEWTHDAGEISIFNVGEGDLNLSLPPKATKEQLADAKLTIERMLKQGYVLLIEDKAGRHRRVKRFDPKRLSYIVRTDKQQDVAVPLTHGKAVAVPRTAGG